MIRALEGVPVRSLSSISQTGSTGGGAAMEEARLFKTREIAVGSAVCASGVFILRLEVPDEASHNLFSKGGWGTSYQRNFAVFQEPLAPSYSPKQQSFLTLIVVCN